jgi:hypothetical protein
VKTIVPPPTPFVPPNQDPGDSTGDAIPPNYPFPSGEGAGMITPRSGNSYRYYYIWHILTMRQRKRRQAAHPIYTPGAPAAQHYGAAVSNSGNSLLDGNYQWNGTLYAKGPFTINKVSNWPSAGVTSWAILQGANIYYYAPDGPTPWQTGPWVVGSFGAAPAPSLALVALK